MPLLGGAAVAQAPALTHGPFRGHVDTTSMHVWARASQPGEHTLELTHGVDGTVVTVRASATGEHDQVLHFAVEGLAAATAYGVRITRGEQVLHAGSTWSTALPDDASAAAIAFGSCAHDQAFPGQPIWGRILARAPQALVLLGDTPYVDVGTVVARRQRHREFFAHPGVAATLRAIPTWTTWDDHDFAGNDQFGAVPASDPARPVFVEYHAHAGYGDGVRGIWTRFRQGPIEVFLLDTRSCADQGESPLAPGARTLLGAAQVAWLQQGLRASTAPIKVLTCGMVWNDGVRPAKQDHWGTWQAERDALFRWLGAQRIDGVVLVSGDVHRSRVILHPTRDLAGYDIPEFVTSPLAQEVLEANAVPTPGLVFDAGEAHSCLFLEAVRGERGPRLRAVFQAGDGREFHVHECAPGTLARPDAAATYRRIVAALRARFGPDVQMPEVEYTDDALGMTAAAAVGAQWRAAVAAVEPQLVEWQQVLDERQCRFARTSAEPMMSEFMQDLLLGLRGLQQLNVAAGLQAIADGQPARLERACASALALARHLQEEPGTMAWAVAAVLEMQAAALCDLAAPLGDEVRGRLRQRIIDHLPLRRGAGAAVVAARLEALQLFEDALAQLRLGKDAQAAVARQFGDAVRRAFVDHLQPVLAAGETLPDEPDPVRRAELERRIDELAAAQRARRPALEALRREGAPQVDAAADLGLILATLLLPSLPAYVDAQYEARERLRAAVR